ncbi:MAG: hypothetical protein AXW17_07850 [Colwellia sp. Phe_37]|jgi:hypothetical protein|nr:MAG: hypothetical protein AXW16_03985 [Cycloclasticus sp. Phe_18]KXJ52539.1 MAG: hypothetical protein AXW17_07850 [Colwellia sp. Phe_37]MEE4291470.1 hypothetical protein [Cycloclasticus sp.]
MKIIVAFFLALLVVQPAYSQRYKCELGGKVSFQQRPCSGGKESILSAPVPTKSDIVPDAEYDKGVTLGAINLRYEPVNSIGSTWFAYKVGVTNNTSETRNIRLKYNALDHDGFLIKSIRLQGNVPPNSYKTLSDRDYLDKAEKGRVYKWELDK